MRKYRINRWAHRKKEDINDLLFDSFGIILRNQNGEYIEVLEMELDGVWNIIIKTKNIIINLEILIIFLIKSNYVFSIIVISFLYKGFTFSLKSSALFFLIIKKI